jgi:uncharacterized protein (DUF1499 family)
MGLFAGKRPSDLGVKDGRLKLAPRSPNAVSSQADDVQHKIAPLSYQTTPAQAMEALAKIIQATPRTRIVTRSDDYLYAEYESALMGYVDDVEFYLEPGSKLIQVRSASRLGHSDFGVNRARIEDIRRKLLASGA